MCSEVSPSTVVAGEMVNMPMQTFLCLGLVRVVCSYQQLGHSASSAPGLTVPRACPAGRRGSRKRSGSMNGFAQWKRREQSQV